MMITKSNVALPVIVAAFILALLVRCGSESTGPVIHDDDTGPLTDVDGNTYQTITIGDQVWMAENLRVTRYRDSTLIPHVTEDTAWRDLTSGAYCNYDNDQANGATYGHLYNWHAVDDSRGLAPEGWHVPTDADWQQLERSLEMSAVDADQYGYRDTRNDDGTFKRIGDKLKDADLWIIRRLGTNSSEFSALPGGCRYHAGQYIFRGCDAFFWTSASYWFLRSLC